MVISTGNIYMEIAYSRCQILPKLKRGRAVHDLVKQAKKFSPTLVKGYSGGNTSVVDKKSWLEVCDRKHRYGANLRAYYNEWKRLGCPTLDFWEWLEDETVEVTEVPRDKLERETVLYCDTKAERQKFALRINNGLIYHDQNDNLVSTREEGWIFVLKDGILYANKKETESTPRIHHTSFVGGECVQAAGMMVIEKGILRIIYPHSGHYRPSENELRILLLFLDSHGIDLNQVSVDVQRVQKVFRNARNGVLVKKLENAHFWNAMTVLCFLCNKFHAWESNVFDELQQVAVVRGQAA